VIDPLDVRFDRIRNDREGDWQDVVQRANGRVRRRRLTLVGALAAVVALGAPTALALRGKNIDFFQSEPAPRRVVVDFARLDVGAPRGMETEVLAEQTRKILVPIQNGRTVTLWVAPTRKGGFCTFVEHGGGGCLPPYSVPLAPSIEIRGGITPDGVIRRGPVLISGSVGIPEADAIELRYRGGEVDRQRLTWVSKPIGVAFFAFDDARDHWNDNRPNELVVLDADGATLRTEPLHFRPPPGIDAKTGAPNEAVVDQGRKLIAVRTHTGAETALWVAPTTDGRSCYWLRYGTGGFGGGCPAKTALRPFGLGRSQGAGVVLLWGGPLQQDIAEVQVRYQDGERDLVRVVDAMALWEIRPAHFRRGHRPELLTARDSAGHDVAHQRLPTDNVGAYPCKKPVPIPNGYGERACP
jgi:hypothetical protein